jgi:Zn-finger nucleic acid-binding protein
VAKVKDDGCSDARCRERRRDWERRERDLILDRAAAWNASSASHERAERLTAENAGLLVEIRRLQTRVAELESAHRVETAAEAKPATPLTLPDFVKLNAPPGTPKKPGRKQGHPAALRSMPARVDREVEVPLARDARGRELCPRCRGVLTDLREHERLVEDLTPVQVEVVKYRTRSGRCLGCDCRRESRASEQPPPPAGDVPHGQLGLNALAMGVMLRVRHRLTSWHSSSPDIGNVMIWLVHETVSGPYRGGPFWPTNDHIDVALRCRKFTANEDTRTH